ncbi:MAG TPA: 50S ribosomal protein L25 [Bacteroidia bacterium]
MKSVQIKAEVRSQIGKKNSLDLRRAGRVPAVIYGGNEVLHISVDEREVNTLLYTPEVLIAEIDLGGKTVKAVVQDAQFHVLTDATTHVDFMEVVDGKPLKVALPVRTVGNSVGVRAGGKLKVIMRKLKVKGMADKLPAYVDVDITDVNIGQTVRVKQINIDGVEFLDAKDNVICTVAATRASRQESAATATPAKKKK